MSTLKMAAASQRSKTALGELFAEQPTGEMLASTHTQELVIALCGPIGSPLHEVGDKLKEMLQRTFGYERCKVIRLSAFIAKHAEQARKVVRADAEGRRNDLITIGDEMRRQYGHSVLAELAVNEIRVDREMKDKHART
jgi:hypothetical protein